MKDPAERSQETERPLGVPLQTRQAYEAPTVKELGRLEDLTKGGNQEQRGEGPGFSL